MEETERERQKYFLGGLVTGGILGVATTLLGGMILRREVVRILHRRLRDTDPGTGEETPDESS